MADKTKTSADISAIENELGVTDAKRQTKGSFTISDEGKKVVKALLDQHKGVFQCNAEAFLKKYTDAESTYITEKVGNKSAASPWWPVGQTANKQFDDVKVTGNGKEAKGTLKFVQVKTEEAPKA